MQKFGVEIDRDNSTSEAVSSKNDFLLVVGSLTSLVSKKICWKFSRYTKEAFQPFKRKKM